MGVATNASFHPKWCPNHQARVILAADEWSRSWDTHVYWHLATGFFGLIFNKGLRKWKWKRMIRFGRLCGHYQKISTRRTRRSFRKSLVPKKTRRIESKPLNSFGGWLIHNAPWQYRNLNMTIKYWLRGRSYLCPKRQSWTIWSMCLGWVWLMLNGMLWQILSARTRKESVLPEAEM